MVCLLVSLDSDTWKLFQYFEFGIIQKLFQKKKLTILFLIKLAKRFKQIGDDLTVTDSRNTYQTIYKECISKLE